jgi:hypothetical protein
MPNEGNFVMLGPDQSPSDSPYDMPSNDDDQRPPLREGVGEERTDDPATQRIEPDQIRLMGK